MSDFQKLTDLILEFREERDWKKFHTPKNSAIALVNESSELLEHFKWHEGKETEKYIKKHRIEIEDELSDVLFWILLMAHDLEININKAFLRKMKQNARKYPVEKAKGKSLKYTAIK